MEQTGWQVSEPRVQPSTSKIWLWKKSYLPDIFNYFWKPHPVIVRLKNQKSSRSLVCKYSFVNDFQRRNWFNIYMLELQNLYYKGNRKIIQVYLIGHYFFLAIIHIKISTLIYSVICDTLFFHDNHFWWKRKHLFELNVKYEQ
jgi:pyrroloquinoline quinone (PQQ) biosynthesis protein C